MASGKNYSVGLRNVWIYALNTSTGLIAPTTAGSASPYEGLQVVCGKAFDLTIPDPRRIQHTGDDHVQQIDALPTLEAATGVLRVAREDMATYALLSNTLARTLGPAVAVGLLTDQQGTEPQVGMLAWQQALNEAGMRNYRSFNMPKTLAFLKPGSMGENATEHTYNIYPQIATAAMWGEAYTLAADGFTSSELQILQHTNKPKLIAWALSGSAATAGSFAFPTGTTKQPASGSASIAGVWNNGVTASYVYTAGSPGNIYIAGSAAAGAVFTCLYETL